MLTTPPALPDRDRGTLVMIARLFGDWKNPNPSPQIVMRQTMSAVVGCAGSSATSTSPTARTASPTPPNTPAG